MAGAGDGGADSLMTEAVGGSLLESCWLKGLIKGAVSGGVSGRMVGILIGLLIFKGFRGGGGKGWRFSSVLSGVGGILTGFSISFSIAPLSRVSIASVSLGFGIGGVAVCKAEAGTGLLRGVNVAIWP